MRTAAKWISLIALVAVALSPVLFMTGACAQSQMKSAALAATLVWFITAPLWIRRAEDQK